MRRDLLSTVAVFERPGRAGEGGCQDFVFEISGYRS